MPNFIFTWSTSGQTTIEAQTLAEAKRKWEEYKITSADLFAADFQSEEILEEIEPGIYDTAPYLDKEA